MAKGIGNGFPMAAVVTTPEIAATMAKVMYLRFVLPSPFLRFAITIPYTPSPFFVALQRRFRVFSSFLNEDFISKPF
jgi:hypothetical protein